MERRKGSITWKAHINEKLLSEHTEHTRGDVSGATGSADLELGDIPGTHFKVFHQVSIILDGMRSMHMYCCS
ncbi:hypothetical protein ATANTOWER_011424 [Ataeniobius toweri]|uniref:Uncharacterized protein n=1 Tax=Ataeniobius toweri TaxID=208326 RepID=A0ABU7BST7_9TELE|nr:hypothetical protein [Ataeniobius toweri]